MWRFKEAEPKLTAFVQKYPNGRFAEHARKCLADINPNWKINEDGVVAYSGKYEKDIRLQAALINLPKRKKESFQLLEQRLGIDLAPYTRVVFAFEDAGRDSKGGLVAVTSVVGIDNQPTIAIRFYTEHVVTSPQTYHTTIPHEIKHAGFLGIMGHAYSDLPKWIREGLALYSVDDHLLRVDNVLLNEIIAGRDPAKVLDGIDDPTNNLSDYLEDGLAFEWLERQQAGNVKRFCKRLVAGEDYKVLLADLTGLPYKQAIAQIDAFCQDYVEDALGDGYEQFAPLLKDYYVAFRKGPNATKQWLATGGKNSLETWLSDNPGHLLEPFALFCLGRALVVAGRYEMGREYLRKVLEGDDRRSSLNDDVQLWLGISYNNQGDAKNARATFGVLLRDFSHTKAATKVYGQMPPAGPVTE